VDGYQYGPEDTLVVVKNEENPLQSAVAIYDLAIYFRTVEIDPEIVSATAFVYYCDSPNEPLGCQSVVSVTGTRFFKFQYTCQFYLVQPPQIKDIITVNAQPVDTYTYECNIPYNTPVVTAPRPGMPHNMLYRVGLSGYNGWAMGLSLYRMPVLQSLYPTTGDYHVNTEISVIGTGFFSTLSLTVFFGDEKLPAQYFNPTMVTFVAPPVTFNSTTKNICVDFSVDGSTRAFQCLLFNYRPPYLL